MNPKFKVSCVQNSAKNNTQESLRECGELVKTASDSGADLICLPEFLSHLHTEKGIFETGAMPEREHLAIPYCSELAKSTGCWLLLGSIAVVEAGQKKRNRSILINPDGEIQARYDKIHMFDVNLGNGEEYRESDVFKPGTRAVVVDTPLAKLGLSVCYDLRFAALYRALAQNGAQVLTVPAAFIHTSGKAHWHVLLRSRAIETGCYIVAPCQYGNHGTTKTYGHSLIVDPWGEILAEGAEDRADVITAEIDLAKVDSARGKIPALMHDRNFEIQHL